MTAWMFKYTNKNSVVVQIVRALLIVGSLALFILYAQQLRERNAPKRTEDHDSRPVTKSIVTTSKVLVEEHDPALAIRPGVIRPTFQNPCDMGVFLIIVIPTSSKHISERRAIRKTWGTAPEAGVSGKKWLTIFLIEKEEGVPSGLQKVFEKEKTTSNDLFIDDELTDSATLFIEASKWILDEFRGCRPRFVLQSHDIVFVNVEVLVPWLLTIETERVYMGRQVRLEREYAAQQNIQVEEYIKGPVILFSMTSVDLMIKQQNRHQMSRKTYSHVSDAVYLGMLALMGGVTPLHSKELMTLHHEHVKVAPCGYLWTMFSFDVKPSDHYNIQKKIALDKKDPGCLKHVSVNGMHTDLK